MNKKIKSIVKNGCDERHQMSDHAFVCKYSETCPCAEQCLNRGSLFTPKDAAIVWMATHHVNHNHNYRTEQWRGLK